MLQKRLPHSASQLSRSMPPQSPFGLLATRSMSWGIWNDSRVPPTSSLNDKPILLFLIFLLGPASCVGWSGCHTFNLWASKCCFCIGLSKGISKGLQRRLIHSLFLLRNAYGLLATRCALTHRSEVRGSLGPVQHPAH